MPLVLVAAGWPTKQPQVSYGFHGASSHFVVECPWLADTLLTVVISQEQTMRNLFIASFALLALLIPMVIAANRPPDEQPTKKRLNQFQAAWNKDDTAAMAAMWAEDGTLINPFGTAAQGRDAVTKIFVDEHSGLFKATEY